MAETYEQWSSWGAWHNPRYDRPAQTVTYIRTRTLWLRSRDPKVASRVIRTEKQYKTERLSKPVGEPQPPTPPRPETPTKTEPSSEYLPPTEESKQVASDAAIKKLQGTYVDVKVRTPRGYVKTFTTKRFDPSKVGGEVMSIGVSSPYKNIKSDPFYDVSKEVLATEASIPKLKREWSESDFTVVPNWYRKQFSEVVPGVGVVQGAKIPDIVKELGVHEQYVRHHYSSSLGMLGTDFSKAVNELIESNMTQAVAKREYTWNGKTFAQLKKEEPALYMTGTGSAISIQPDTKRWRNEELTRAWREGDWGFIAGDAFSSTFMGPRADYMWESLRSGRYDPKTGTTYIGGEKVDSWKLGYDTRTIASGVYGDYKMYGEKDWGGLGKSFIRGPGGMLALYGGFKGVGFVARKTGPVIKTIVRKIPVVYEKVTPKFPTVFNTTALESGKLLQTRASGFSSQLGRTGFYKNIQGWASGSLTRARTLPMVGRPVTHDIGGGFTQKAIKYKGFGKVAWEPSKKAFQTPVGKTGFAEVQYVDSTVGRGLRSVSRFEYVSKPSGHLWWKKMTTISTSRTTFTQSPFHGPPTTGATDMWGGFVRPSSSYQSYISIGPKYSFIKDTGASASLTRTVHHVPVHGGRMTTSGLLSSLQAGSPYTITAPTTMFTIPSSAFSFAPVVATGLIVGSKSLQGLDYKMKQYSIQKPAFDVSSLSAKALSQKYMQLQLSGFLQSSIQEQSQVQKLLQSQMQKQLTISTLSYKTVSKFKGAGAYVPHPVVTPFKPHIPKLFFIPNLGGVSKKVKRLKPFDLLGKGYRFRSWSALTMKDFVGGNW